MEIKNLDYSRFLSDAATGIFGFLGIILIFSKFIDFSILIKYIPNLKIDISLVVLLLGFILLISIPFGLLLNSISYFVFANYINISSYLFIKSPACFDNFHKNTKNSLKKLSFTDFNNFIYFIYNFLEISENKSNIRIVEGFFKFSRAMALILFIYYFIAFSFSPHKNLLFFMSIFFILLIILLFFKNFSFKLILWFVFNLYLVVIAIFSLTSPLLILMIFFFFVFLLTAILLKIYIVYSLFNYTYFKRLIDKDFRSNLEKALKEKNLENMFISNENVSNLV